MDNSIQHTSSIDMRGRYSSSRNNAFQQAPPKEAGASSEDSVDISPTAQLIGKLSEMSVFGVKPRADGSIHIEDIQEAHEKNLASFQYQATELMRQEGIDTSASVDLICDREGKVRVADNHPDKEKIEAIFASNEELSNQFRGISATGSFLQAVERSMEFQKAYLEDPIAAVDAFADLFDNRSETYRLRLSDKQADEFYQ